MRPCGGTVEGAAERTLRGPAWSPSDRAGGLSTFYSQPVASWPPQDAHSFLNLKGIKSWWNHLEVSPYLVEIAPYLEGFCFSVGFFFVSVFHTPAGS